MKCYGPFIGTSSQINYDFQITYPQMFEGGRVKSISLNGLFTLEKQN